MHEPIATFGEAFDYACGSGECSTLLVGTISIAFAAIHVFTPGRSYFDSAIGPAVVSLGSGVSVAYVFAHLLPEVGAARRLVVHGEWAPFPIQLPTYLIAMVGFVTFYGLEHFVQRFGGGSGDDSDEDGDAAFWLHVGFFACYNLVLGYLLVGRAAEDVRGVVLFGLAIGMHILVNDNGLRRHHGAVYRRSGRWVLAATVVFGTALGVFAHVHEAVPAVALSFLAGSVVFSVVKEELPTERANHFAAFLVGTVVFTALLVTV